MEDGRREIMYDSIREGKMEWTKFKESRKKEDKRERKERTRTRRIEGMKGERKERNKLWQHAGI